jgi:replication factor C large subunit
VANPLQLAFEKTYITEILKPLYRHDLQTVICIVYDTVTVWIGELMALPWTEKYRPTSVKEYVDNGKALRQLDEWLTSWTKGTPRKKAAFLHGPPGVGKTVCVEVLAKAHDFDLIALDASNWRTKNALERIVGAASSQRPLIGAKERLVVLDELEGMSGTQDRGGLSTITRLTKTTGCPMILIANDVWNPRFSSLRSSCTVIKFQRVPVRSIIAHIRRICVREGILAEEEALSVIAKRSKGDLRSAMTDLQALSQGKSFLAYEDVRWLGDRDRQEAIFTVLGRVFNAETCWEARRAVDVADVDYEMLFEWIYENAPHQLSNIEDLSTALDALSRADIYFRRVRAFRAWKLLKYAFDQMTAGVAMSREKSPRRWVSFKFPQRISVMSRTRRKRRLRKELGLKLGATLHMSSDSVVRDVLPYLRIMFSNDDEATTKLMDTFGLDETLVAYLRESGG